MPPVQGTNVNICTNLILAEQDVLLNIFATNRKGLSLLIFSQLFSKVAVSDARYTNAKAEFNMK